MVLICHPISLWQRPIRVYYRETKAPDVLDSGYPQWDTENSIMQMWLINSMDMDISRTYLFLPSAKELWEAVIETYYDHGNAAQCFEIKSQLRD